jgi:serine/threonine-protein kinase
MWYGALVGCAMVGRTVLQYQFLEKLGAGGMGEVYKARDMRLNRLVAIKVLVSGTSADQEQRRRFLHEAQAASSLNHPNIITIYDIFTEADTQYLVSEFINGKTLLQLISEGPLRVPGTIDYAIQMADALGAAHAAGIIHRDIKPANVMITGGGLVKVLDFGLAKLMEGLTGGHTGNTATVIEAPLTIAGSVMGTVNYMSPEQAEGKRVTTRSDVFSFGAVLYEMLTGRCAFRGESMVSTLSAVLRDDVQPMVELTPGLPPEIEQIVAKCLKKDPDQRFQSMGELQAALVTLRRRYEAGTPFDEPTVRTVLPSSAGRNSKTVAMGGVSAIVIVAALGGWYWWMTRHSAIAPPIAQTATQAAPTAAPPEETLTNESIIAMTQAKVAPTVIISQIRSSKTNFNLSAAQIIGLTRAGVSSDVIEVMRNPQPGSAPATSGLGSVLSGVPPPALKVAPIVITTPVVLSDGLPLNLTLAKDISGEAQPGDPVTFTAADNVMVDGSVVIAKGAAATGRIVDGVKRKALVMRSKMTLLLESVDAVDGQKVALRATAERRRGELPKRPVITGADKSGGEKSKETAADAGTLYTAYIDAKSTVMVKK